MIIENELIKLELNDIPYPSSYKYKPTEETVVLPQNTPNLFINNKSYPLADFSIDVSQTEYSVCYICSQPDEFFEFKFKYSLNENKIEVLFEILKDENKKIKYVDFNNMPLIFSDNIEKRFFRQTDAQSDWSFELKGGGRGLHWGGGTKNVKIIESIPEHCDNPSLHACLSDDKTGVFINTNYPILPIKTRIFESEIYKNRGGSASVSLNTYQYRVRNTLTQPLKAEITFIEDVNGDGIFDECDYMLYRNRAFPNPNPFYLDKISYKIMCCTAYGKVVTTLEQVEKIIQIINNMTGGIPQIAYLVGWQEGGHDNIYPALNIVNSKLGTAEDFNNLAKKAKEQYNTTLSYHINIDDAYPKHPCFDESVISKDYDGSMIKWIEYSEWLDNPTYHISHTKNVESGKVFERLEEFFDVFDVENTVHTDAIRITNESWDNGEYIGMMEELVCGLIPIQKFLNDRGIDNSAEGINGMPMDGPGYFSCFYHNSMGMLFHGKLIGGGYCKRNNWSWGNGANIDSDIVYADAKEHEISYHNSHELMDNLYCGSVLYLYMLQHEMLSSYDINDPSLLTGATRLRKITMSDNINIVINRNTDGLSIYQNDVMIARDYDRFIPLNGQLYCYSRNGLDEEYLLPKEFRNKNVTVNYIDKLGNNFVKSETTTDYFSLTLRSYSAAIITVND